MRCVGPWVTVQSIQCAAKYSELTLNSSFFNNDYLRYTADPLLLVTGEVSVIP